MKILYLTQYFPPEICATETRNIEMAKGLVGTGHQVTVITEVPNHPAGKVPTEYLGKVYDRVELDGIDVIRVRVKELPVKSFRNHLLLYLSYMFMSLITELLLVREKIDVMYVTSPPRFVVSAALAMSYLRRLPFVFGVHDLWPESAF